MEKGDSYGAIAQSYASFVTCHYDKATVVCVGYDKVHLLKTTLINDVDKILIQRSASMWIQCSREKKEDFLSTPCNKQGLIDMITRELQAGGSTVINAPGGADLDIAKASIKASQPGASPCYRDLDQIPLPQSVLPDHGVDWEGNWHECGGLGMESGEESACGNHDQQTGCPRNLPENGSLLLHNCPSNTALQLQTLLTTMYTCVWFMPG